MRIGSSILLILFDPPVACGPNFLLASPCKTVTRAQSASSSSATAAGKAVLVDPKGNDFSIYQDATLITPNQAEFETVVGACESELEFIEKGEALLEQLNIDARWSGPCYP